jgi:hypothetical protein
VKLKSRNIKRIHIIGQNGNEPSKVMFEIFEPLKKKKITSTWFPNLYGASDFNKKGDEVLKFYNFLEGDAFNNFYSLRGFIAERIIQDSIKKKGYPYRIFKDTFDIFLYTKEGDNKLYKYFGGLPDLIYEKDGSERLLEVKSKELVKKNYVESNPPQTEIMQGKMLALLRGLDRVSMTYVLFGEKAERSMYLAMNSPFDLQVSVKKFDEIMPVLKYKEDYEIVVKDYTVNKNELLEQMKTAYKYADGFRQTLTLNLDDLSEEVRKQIFELEMELEEDFKKK